MPAGVWECAESLHGEELLGMGNNTGWNFPYSVHSFHCDTMILMIRLRSVMSVCICKGEGGVWAKVSGK